MPLRNLNISVQYIGGTIAAQWTGSPRRRNGLDRRDSAMDWIAATAQWPKTLIPRQSEPIIRCEGV
jgi:hypothetical protein